MVSVEVFSEKQLIQTRPMLTKFQQCLATCVLIKDRKIFAIAHGFFLLAIGIAFIVGNKGIKTITSSTEHVQLPIPTNISSTLAIVSGILFIILVFLKHRYLVVLTILISTTYGIVSAVGMVHYGTTLARRMTSLSQCLYTTVQRSCTCVINTEISKATYKFENTASCSEITIHLKEIVYGLCGVYSAALLACLGTIVYGVLLLHKIQLRKIKFEIQSFEETKLPLKEKLDFEEFASDDVPIATKKGVAPWQQDAATQTGEQRTGNECRHQCRHFVEVTVPDVRNDYIVNVSKSRDPPPPYCEAVYT